MALLCIARLLVALVPFERWRWSLGLAWEARADVARQHAADVTWGAKRLPFETRCLPRAMTLSWLLRRRQVGHSVVIAVRPAELRRTADALHAWVEVDGQIVLGELPGPWLPILRLGG